jgi:hypothetical protein
VAVVELKELDVDGTEVKEGVILMGKATRQPDGTWRCLANVFGSLCVVEISIKPIV